MAINGVPLDARFARPIAEGDELADAIAAVEADFRQALPLATAFHLRDAPRVIEAYLMWCDLLHPSRKKSALTRLRANLEEPGVASALVSLALAYDHEFDPTELLAYLARRDALGGLSNDDLRALLAGEVVAGVERDLPAGRVPVGVGE